uniref:Uncharacterized protein n=1 Tax=Romanomermis culicivorax TaxID=13658 RepID=A0A915JM50_ROMCU
MISCKMIISILLQYLSSGFIIWKHCKKNGLLRKTLPSPTEAETAIAAAVVVAENNEAVLRKADLPRELEEDNRTRRYCPLVAVAEEAANNHSCNCSSAGGYCRRRCNSCCYSYCMVDDSIGSDT